MLECILGMAVPRLAAWILLPCRDVVDSRGVVTEAATIVYVTVDLGKCTLLNGEAIVDDDLLDGEITKKLPVPVRKLTLSGS